MDSVETIELEHGVKITIELDTDAESPREWSPFGEMLCWHRRYKLGDKHEYSNPSDFTPDKRGVCLPLYLYDHSGITMSTKPFSCPWDSGRVGYIYASPDAIRKEYGVKRITKAIRERVTAVLMQEVETYDQFLTGEVYGYVIETPDDDNADSCWGFFGLDYAIGEAKSAAKHYVDKYADAERMSGADI